MVFPPGSPRAPTVVPKKEQMATMKSYPPFAPFTNENDGIEGPSSMLVSPPLVQSSFSGADTSISPEPSATIISSLEEDYVIKYSCPPNKGSPSTGGTIAREVLSSSSVATGEVSNTSSNRSDLSMNILEGELVHEDMHDQLDFGNYFQEGYCKAASQDESHELTEVVTDVDSSASPCNKANSEEDGDSDDMLGGVFAFSEEGA